MTNGRFSYPDRTVRRTRAIARARSNVRRRGLRRRVRALPAELQMPIAARYRAGLRRRMQLPFRGLARRLVRYARSNPGHYLNTGWTNTQLAAAMNMAD